MDKFVALHKHGEFSLLDGTGSAKEHADRCAELEQPAMALTDHGNMCGALHHIEACMEHDIVPISGMEAYFKPNRLLKDKDNKKANHTTLWALSMKGWHSLLRLSSEAHDTGFYYRPCADWDLFERYNEGLAASTGCMAGPVPQAILSGDDKLVKEYCDKLDRIFDDRMYVELMPHDIDEQRVLNIELARIAQERGWPVLATTDAHYPRQDWAGTQDIMLMIATGQTLSKRRAAEEKGEDVYKFDLDTFYLMDRETVEGLFEENHPELPKHIVQEACDQTVAFVDRIDQFTVDKSDKMPRVKLERPVKDEIVDWCERGMVRIGREDDQEYRDRLEYELSILESKEVLDYFYLVGDLVRWAKNEGVRVGAGRGSAAGCLVSYLIGITNVDPIAYGLLFERFLNPDRASMPDIDLDFQHDRRDEAKDYLADKWGKDHVVEIAAFQTFGLKSSIKDVARVLDIPLQVVIPVIAELDDQKSSVMLEDMRAMSERIKSYASKNPEAWEHAVRLQKKVKGQSKHPAGVVVTDKPATEYIPLMRSKNGYLTTQWSETMGFNAISEYGFLKVDILSTDGLTRQEICLRLIEERTGSRPDIDNLPIFSDPHAVDEEVMDAWRAGDTFGIFQFQSSGITRMIKQIKPTSVDDIVAANALYRPGPLQSGTAFAYGRRKNGEERVDYWHESVKPYMERTYGLLVYQEQVMKVVEQIGGFSPAESDTLRKAMTKWQGSKVGTGKGIVYIQRYREQFIKGAKERGIPKKEAEGMWEKLGKFTIYAFNASHSAGYGVQAYQDMWLKVKYPLEFYTALLATEKDDIPQIVREARGKGIPVLPPNINTSNVTFSVDGDSIRFGLGAIKNVGGVAVNEITKLRREDGPFRSYEDFCERIQARKCNSRVKQSLVDAGAFDEFNMRQGMSQDEIHAAEVEMMGMSISVSIVSDEDLELLDNLTDSTDALDKAQENTIVRVGGEVIAVQRKKTKMGREMASFQIAHRSSVTDVVVFPDSYSKYVREELKVGVLALVKGAKDDRGGVRMGAFTTLDNWVSQKLGEK